MTDEPDNPYVNLVTKKSVVPRTRDRQEEIDRLQIKIDFMTLALREILAKMGIDYERTKSILDNVERM